MGVDVASSTEVGVAVTSGPVQPTAKASKAELNSRNSLFVITFSLYSLLQGSKIACDDPRG